MYGRLDAMSDRMSVSGHDNNDTCKASYKQDRKRERPGAEAPATVLRHCLSSHVGIPKVPASVITPPSRTPSDTDSDEERQRRRKRHIRCHKEGSLCTRLKFPKGYKHGKQNSKSWKTQVYKNQESAQWNLKRIVNASWEILGSLSQIEKPKAT